METSTIDILLGMPLPVWAIPYSLLCLLVAIFGLCTMVSGCKLKELRKLEHKQQQNIKALERRHEQDGELLMQLEFQIDRLKDEHVEDKNLPNPP